MITTILLAIVAAYLIGSVPSGFVVIKLLTGEDLTRLGSGRTGGTNALRAGGVWAGLITGALDILKGAGAVWLARWMLSGQIIAVSSLPGVEALAGVAVVIGHNWSLYLGFRGGAGTGPNVGAAIALWSYAGLILPPFVPLVLFLTGYASVASLCTAMLIPFMFAFVARYAGLPWEYFWYGLGTWVVVTWALRPNIARLLNGTERRVRFGRIHQQRPMTR
ncbi:glycerol-3-phosphate acyltransferase PlsY [Anaerolineae bacterium]|nr:glycerol-3-phosphate acyltransferase PlsY [Anaerolineae bacterium]